MTKVFAYIHEHEKLLHQGFNRMEEEINLGAVIRFQDERWYLFREDGEGVTAGGETFHELVLSLSSSIAARRSS